MSVGVTFRKNRMASKLFDLSGRTSLVTGSSRGLGNALAEGLAAAGATLVLNGRDFELSTAAATLREKGHTVYEALFDVTDEEAVQKPFAKLDHAGISVEILLNNAGIQLRKWIVDFQLPEWEKGMDTNLQGAFC